MRTEIFEGKNEVWYWRLIANNGETLATSEGYATKANALKTAEKVQNEVNPKEVVIEEDKDL